MVAVNLLFKFLEYNITVVQSYGILLTSSFVKNDVNMAIMYIEFIPQAS